jgi:hypothetical protein
VALFILLFYMTVLGAAAAPLLAFVWSTRWEVLRPRVCAPPRCGVASGFGGADYRHMQRVKRLKRRQAIARSRLLWSKAVTGNSVQHGEGVTLPSA